MKAQTRAKMLTALGAAALLVGTACADPIPSWNLAAARSALSAALATVPAGYGELTTSYVGNAATMDASAPMAGGPDARMDRGAMMGGGLHDAFVGGIGFDGDHDGNHGPMGGGLPCVGTFDAGTGRVACTTVTEHGLSITRSAAYTDASGAVQQAFDSLTTNTVNIRTQVSGTITFTPHDSTHHDGMDGGMGPGDGPGGDGHHHDGWGDGRGPGGLLLGDTARIISASTTIRSASDRTVSGLAQGSTQRSANGTSAGQESTTGTSSRGDFTLTRIVGDTTTGLLIPVSTTGPTYPTAGTVIRSMQATLTYTGQTISKTRREVVTYDGTATAKVTVTEDGVTKSCTRPLPRGPLSCQ